MWKSSPFLIFILRAISALLFLAPPSYAISHLGEAWVDWNSLKFSGVPVTVTDMFQRHSIESSTSPPTIIEFKDWRDHTLTQTVPQFATLRNSADADRLYASINTFGSGEGFTSVERGGRITPLETGNLTTSIDFNLRQSEPIPQGIESVPQTGIHFFRDLEITENRLGSEISNVCCQQSFTLPVERGESWFFSVDARVRTTSVPLPDMLLPTSLGLIGIALWVERRRRQGLFMR